MFEELRFYFQESPDRLMGLGVLGVFCLVLVSIVLTRNVRWHMGESFFELPPIKRAGQWIRGNPEAIALAIGALCLSVAVALMANPVRLLQHGRSADGVVTSVIQSTYVDSEHKTRIRSTATIRFQAGDRIMEIERSTSRDIGSWCIAGCFSKGDRPKILYLAEDPETAEVDSFLGLFGGPLMAGIAGALAFLFWWVLRSQSSADKSRPSGPAGE